MAFEYENSGTVNVTNGSKLVSGINTAWVAGYDGCQLNIAGLSIPVASIDSPTQLTLTYAYPGDTAASASYVLVPVKNQVYNVTKNVVDAIDAMNSIIESGGGGGGTGTVGPRGPQGVEGPAGESAYQLAVDSGFSGTEAEWLASLKGEKGDPGEDGAGGSGEGGLGSIVNLKDFAPQPAGGSGVFLIVPVDTGDPGVTLTQSAQVVIPYDKPNAGIGAWITTTTSGLALTIGLTNAPLPQPGGSTEPVDLTGSSTIYGAPGTVFPLGIYLGPTPADTTFNLTKPSGLPLKIENIEPITTPVASTWVTGASGAPYPVTGDAFSSDFTLYKGGDGTWDFQDGRVIANSDCYLYTDALAMEFDTSSDDIRTQTPPRIRVGFKGIVPTDVLGGILISLYDYSFGKLEFGPWWQGETMVCSLGRNGSAINVVSPEFARDFGVEHLYEFEWSDDPAGTGGFGRFFLDGVQQGADVPTEVKLRITPAIFLECNASLGNTSASLDNLAITSLSVAYDKPGTQKVYTSVSGTTIPASDLEKLVVDATAISTNQAAKTLSYTEQGASEGYDLSIIIGEMDIAAGQAYKAVLEDWSTGTGVAHPNELVMTKVAAQNCRFEDDTLFGSQAAWTEVLPQGAVPSINGINYYCEGIKMGNYTQYQFGYDWAPDYMPAAPFGDPTADGGKETYMVPHKWMIYDAQGALIHRVEKPNGQPLNSADTKPVWEGTRDGRSVPQITTDNPHYPHGTVRSGIIWRSADPVDYDQQFVWNNVPTYDFRVPFAGQTGYSVNGFDLRVGMGGAGGDGQMNGYANYCWQPWDSSTYQAVIDAGAATLNPYKVGTNSDAQTPNAAAWLSYTPFHSNGRSPITGPGGSRNDRQIMPEAVARYAQDVTSARPHDNRANKQIALNCLTGYVSDAVHPVENGRFTPLFKGDPRRNITMRNHYYGPGEATTPATQAYYVQGGRLSDWTSSQNPLRVQVPKSGKIASKPYFGTFDTDDDHSHQFPYWGSLLFQTPEFAMLGHKHWDQPRLYLNEIIAPSLDCISNRGQAWKFIHAALAWKTASANSSRLYSRDEIMDYVVYDFETYYDDWYVPYVLTPVTNVMTDGEIDWAKVVSAGAKRFGPVFWDDSDGGQGCYSHDFMVGYWLSGLHAAHRMGFLDALREASDKAAAILDWLLAIHRTRAVGRVNNGYLINACPNNEIEYITTYWTVEQITAANGDVSKLPQDFAAVQAAQPKLAPSWDTYYGADLETVWSRDGQSADQFLAAPSLLKDMGMTGSDIDLAITNADTRFQQKVDEEEARGAGDQLNGAGTGWFVYHQATNNRPYQYPAND